MAVSAFDTLNAARRLKAAGIESEHAEAIVGVMGRSVNQLVTVEHFDAEIAKLHADNAKLHARIDGVEATVRALRADLRADNSRSHLISAGVMIASNALLMGILGVVLTYIGMV